MVHVQDSQGLQVINPHRMRITVEQQMVALLGSAKCFLGSLTLGNVVENDNPTLPAAIRTSERSTRNADQTASQHMLIANKNLRRVNTFTAHGSHQRQLIG